MPKDLSRVQTVVIAMLENRSFDHILGYLGLPDSGHPLAGRIEGIQHAQVYYAHDTWQAVVNLDGIFSAGLSLKA